MESANYSLARRIFACVAINLCLVATSLAQEAQRGTPEPPKIIRKSGGVLQASATRRVEPTYPPLAKAAQISGSVVVEIVTDEEGSVISARAVSGHPLLKDAAVAAARGWKFKPTLLSGDPVKVIGTITFNFQLGAASDDPTGIKELEKQVSENPDSPELLLKLGVAYRSFVGEEKAIEVFKRAIEIKPGYLEAYCELGTTYHSLGRDDEAVETASTVLKIGPESRSAVYANLLIGTISLLRERVPEAIERFKNALNMQPISDSESDAAHTGLGYAYVKAGDKQSAMKEYEILRLMEAPAGRASKHIKSLIDAMP